MEKESSIDKLKYFLKEMFQFNSNDLDFGIYRIYNLKRKDIENFIDGSDKQCLEPLIIETLDRVKNIERDIELAGLHAYLSKLNQQDLLNMVEENYEQIKRFIETSMNENEKLVLLKSLDGSVKGFTITDELKDKIYNHILGFFEMYYSNGDFGYNNRSRNLYKVPYEADYDGNDTMFHWKHKGSLYIKSANSFNAIKFKLKHLNKEFEMRLETNDESAEEGIARNNNKDTKIKHYKFNRFEEKDGVTRIIFNLSESSTTKADLYKAIFEHVFKSKDNIDKYLSYENDKGETKPIFNDLTDDYDKVLDGSIKGIGALRMSRDKLLKRIGKTFKDKEKIVIDEKTGMFTDKTLETLYNIDQKLNSFYIGNDSDYFIHENLQEFLTKEKERYIKNYILDDLNSILDGKLDNTTIIIAKSFDLVCKRIIEFLSSIEEFQKKLFTMKKKVVESEYCMTIDNIDEKYYKEILENKAQLSEWERLFSLSIKDKADLKAQPTLVLDTRFFKQKDGGNPFKDKILSEIDNLDERTNGVLLSSENYQALSLILEKYRGKIDCIHIDPPYNSNTSGFLYKNSFRHSSWISMMDNRLEISYPLMTRDGSILCHIDENEYESLFQIMDKSRMANAGTLIWDKRNPMNGGSGLALQHEYVLWRTNKSTPIKMLNQSILSMLEKAAQLIEEEKQVNDKVRKEFSRWVSKNNHLSGGEKAYKFIDNKGNVYRGVSLRAPEPRTDKKFFIPLIHPITGKPCEVPPNGFSRTPETLQDMIDNGEILFGKDESTQPQQKKLLTEESNRQLASIIQNAIKGKTELTAMGLDFPYSHSTSFYEQLIGPALQETSGLLIDFFAGSGTSGHAVINLNKLDDGNRKYILTEMGKYINDVTKPRILKAVYSENWSEGKPIDNDGSKKHILKYELLEQYEDILDSIERFEGEIPKELPLRYLYNPELNNINSTIDLSKPFSNKIKYGQPTKEGYVDLIETYNYIQGYEIKGIKTHKIKDKYYKVIETTTTLVIWRDITLGEDDSKAIIEIIKKYPVISSVEVNYDFNILAAGKDKIIHIDERVIDVNIIHSNTFND